MKVWTELFREFSTNKFPWWDGPALGKGATLERELHNMDVEHGSSPFLWKRERGCHGG
jgi:hypothetical protein